MDIRFGFSEGAEHCDRTAFNRGAVTRAFDDFHDLREMTMGSRHVIAQNNRGPRAPYAHLGRSFDFEPEFGRKGEFRQLAAQVVHRYADVDHCANVHVARDSAEAVVEKGCRHGEMLTQHDERAAGAAREAV